MARLQVQIVPKLWIDDDVVYQSKGFAILDGLRRGFTRKQLRAVEVA